MEGHHFIDYPCRYLHVGSMYFVHIVATIYDAKTRRRLLFEKFLYIVEVLVWESDVRV